MGTVVVVTVAADVSINVYTYMLTFIFLQGVNKQCLIN